METQKGKEGILTGYRVLDVTDEKGLFCGKVLGDYGADVIKVEPPGGDPARDIGPFYKEIPDRNKSLFWFFTNSSKRGITLNLETVDGREIFKRLVKTAHFVIESFDPGYMAGLGLGYDDLEKINPGLVMTSITPYGQKGPYAHYKADGYQYRGHGRAHAALRRGGPPARRASASPRRSSTGRCRAPWVPWWPTIIASSPARGSMWMCPASRRIILTLMHCVEMWDVNKVNYRGGGPFSIINRPLPLGPTVSPAHLALQGRPCLLLCRGWRRRGARRSSEFFVKWANEEGYALEIKDLDWADVELLHDAPGPVGRSSKRPSRPFS